MKLAGAAATEADSGPASLEDVMYPLKRATAIGRSPSTPAAAQPVTVPPDVARGTLFGRSIHLPDVNAPDAADIELSSGAVQFLDGAPGGSQPFPLANRPAVVVPPPTSPPAARFHTPFDVDAHTQVVDPPRSKAFKRLLAFVGGLSIAGAGVWAWWQYGGGHAASSNPPAVAAPVATPPSIDPMPPSAATAPAGAARPRPRRRPRPRPAAPAAARARAHRPRPQRPRRQRPSGGPRPRRSGGRARPRAPTRCRRAPAPDTRRRERRHAAAKRSPAAARRRGPAAPSKPGRAHKARQDEDPDATMAPSD